MLLNTVGSPRSPNIGHVHSVIMYVRQSEHYTLNWAFEGMVKNFPGRKNQYRFKLHY